MNREVNTLRAFDGQRSSRLGIAVLTVPVFLGLAVALAPSIAWLVSLAPVCVWILARCNTAAIIVGALWIAWIVPGLLRQSGFVDYGGLEVVAILGAAAFLLLRQSISRTSVSSEVATTRSNGWTALRQDLVRGVIVLSATAIVSSVMASSTWDLRSAVRLGLFLSLYLAPFALIAFFSPDGGYRRSYARSLMLLAGLQVVVMAAQAFSTNSADRVVGTLIGAHAGAHVAASGVSIAAVWAFAQTKLRSLRLGIVVVTAVVCLLADARTVLFVFPLGLITVQILETSVSSGRHFIKTAASATVGAVVVVTVLAGIVIAWRMTPSVAYVSDQLVRGGKYAVVEALVANMGDSESSALVGFGPASTVSRSAFLADQASSTILEPEGLGSKTAELSNLVSGNIPRGEVPSVLSAQSSAVGLLGDVGAIGVLTYAWLVWRTVHHLLRVRTAKRIGAVAVWAVALPLGVAFDWWEQSSFMGMVAAITVLSLWGGTSRARNFGQSAKR